MSSIVLLNKDGVVVRKLQFVHLPEDYVVPEGMMVSWRIVISISYSRPSAGLLGSPEPVEAYFYLGNARGTVCRENFKDFERGESGRAHYGSRIITITVQGTSAKDVMELRNRIMCLINSGTCWKTVNDLNPKLESKIGLLCRLFEMILK